eukprot:gnl/Chilomastix_cuspidata/3620.p1 GENE.gnl/Chilomastix_cuspidata/3620~~gnl/Chilomastix_cuspidata/3620.p1  ORF type:complete len:228 (+),score=76.30 gnl/Chilomastix_cuspidata/3620:182-865(+)
MQAASPSDEARLQPVVYDTTKQYDDQFKMVILGSMGVGKTAIIQNFIENRSFDESIGPSATIGGCYSSVIVNYGGRNILLKCWDTGGQERHVSLTASYYRDAAVALVVFSWTDRDSWDAEIASVRFWVAELRRNNPQCRVVLVGNKTDIAEAEPTRREVLERAVLAYAAETDVPFVATSAKTSIGIQQAFREALRQYTLQRGLGAAPAADAGAVALEEPSLDASGCC